MSVFNELGAMQAQRLKGQGLGGISVAIPTLTEKLEEKKKLLTQELAYIEIALESLKKNPEFQNAIDAISKIQMY